MVTSIVPWHEFLDALQEQQNYTEANGWARTDAGKSPPAQPPARRQADHGDRMESTHHR